MNEKHIGLGPLTRRGFLGLAGAAVAAPLLAACGGGDSGSGSSGGGGGGGNSGGTLKFWDQPWGPASYSALGKKITEGYTPPEGFGKVTYQTIQWNNFYQTYASAIASKTGPAVSSGGGFQAFQFAEQGAIAYADKLLESLKADGMYEDFLPGVLDTMKTDKGYVAVPWQLDMRVMWYNKELLDKAGAKPPTSWDEFLEAGKALKKIDVFGFGTGTGAGNNLGAQALVGLMINNGGGMFNAEGKPDCVTDANVEAMEFVREMVAAGMVDPASLSYTGDNLLTQWTGKKIGMGVHTSGLATEAAAIKKDLDVTTPLTSRNGTKQALMFVNNLMMYTNTPSQEASEAFLKYYLGEMEQYWKAGVVSALPVLKSIVETKEFQSSATQVKIAEEWQPVSKTYSQRGDKLFADIASVDGGQALTQFAQTMLQGKTDARQALTTLQQGIESVVK